MARMRQSAPPHRRRHRFYRALPAVLLAALALHRAVANDLPRLYPSGAGGRSQVKAAARAPASDSGVNPGPSGRFKENHLASKGMGGLRPIPLLGADPTAFLRGVGTCPVNHRTCKLQALRLDRTDPGFAGGARGQLELGAWAARDAYKRFIAVGGPELPHLAFRVMAAMRPIPLFGAELARIDLGHPGGGPGGLPTDVSMRGTGAFGVLYLPLPSPVADVYAKAGLARLQSTLQSIALPPGVATCSANRPTCIPQSFRLERTDTSFAGGAGAQVKLGSWALRAEYQRFMAAGGHPGLLSVGFTWSFR
jgi:hypothetical protein